MALPTVLKTYQHAHTVVAGFGSGNTSQQYGEFALAVKNHIKGFALGGPSSGPPQLRGSVTGAGVGGMDGVDRWSSRSDVGNTQTVNHPWVCFRFADGSELLISGRGSSTSAGTAGILFWYSPAAGFVHTLVTARPTATDERAINGGSSSTATGIASSTALQHVFHTQLSTDGTQLRILCFTGGACTSIHGVSRLVTKKTGIISLAWLWAHSSAGSTANVALSSYIAGIYNGAWVATSLTTPATLAGVILPTYIQNVNTQDGSWPLLPIGVAGASVGGFGVQALVPDIWLTSTLRATGDGYPKTADALGAEDQFSVAAAVVIPNPTGIPLVVA